jgi:hypothetical protein
MLPSALVKELGIDIAINCVSGLFPTWASVPSGGLYQLDVLATFSEPDL